MAYPAGFEALVLLLLLATIAGTYNLLSQMTSYGTVFKVIVSLLVTAVLGTFMKYVLLAAGSLSILCAMYLVARRLGPVGKELRRIAGEVSRRVTKVW